MPSKRSSGSRHVSIERETLAPPAPPTVQASKRAATHFSFAAIVTLPPTGPNIVGCVPATINASEARINR